MKDFNEHSKPGLTRCIVTYNQAGIAADAVMDLLRSIAIPEERFTEGSFRHLEGIGSSVIDLTKREINAIKEMKYRVAVRNPASGITVIDVIEDMKAYASAPWDHITAIPAHIRLMVQDNIGRAIRIGRYDRGQISEMIFTPAFVQSASLMLLAMMQFRDGNPLTGRLPAMNGVNALRLMATAGGLAPMIFAKKMTKKPRPVITPGTNLQAINAPKAWARGIRGRGVKIAVLDTGIDKTHPDLQGTVHRGIAIVGQDSCTDKHGHGTHCAGIIAGSSGIGVAPEAELYSVKVLAGNGEGFLSDVLAGMEWVIRRNKRLIDRIDIVSTSIALERDTKPAACITQAVRGLKKTGCVVVAGTGNDGNDINAPANSMGVIAVGAVGGDNRPWHQSSFGGSYNQVTIVAPGVDIKTTGIRRTLGDRYAMMNGTSAACAHVSGVVALIKQRFPSLTPDQITAHLKATANSSGTLNDAEKYGAGLTDCDKATTMFS